MQRLHPYIRGNCFNYIVQYSLKYMQSFQSSKSRTHEKVAEFTSIKFYCEPRACIQAKTLLSHISHPS